MESIKRVCAVCGSAESKPWFRPAQSPGPIVQCAACGLVYVNPIETTHALIEDWPPLTIDLDPVRHSANLADIQGRLEEPVIYEYLQELEPKRVNALDAFKRIARWQTNPGRQLLDVGCFCGVFLSVAQAQGWTGTGLEPLIGAAIYARATYGLPIVNDVLRPDSFPPNAFDVITAFQVFEHLIHPDEQLENLKPMLKPGGLLLIEVPNIATPLVKLLGPRHRHFVQDHVSLFSAQTLTRLLEAHGFTVRQVYYPARALSLRHFAWWLRKTGVTGMPQSEVSRRLPERLLQQTIRFNLGDIVAVIAQKVS